jgi:hypothetical protein
MPTLVVLYVILGSGMAWGYTTSKKNPRKPIPKFVSILSAAAIVVIALLSPFLSGGDDYQGIEAEFRRSYLTKLAENLGQQVVGPGKVLVIHSYDEKEERSRERLEKSIEYLEEGFAGTATIAKTVNPIPPSTNSEDEDYFEVTGKQLNDIVEASPECNIVVFLISLPYGIDELVQMRQFHFPAPEGSDAAELEAENPPFKKFDAKKLPVFGVTVSTNLRDLKYLIQQKRISSAIAWNPNADLETEVTDLPDDLNEVFAMRYMLVNSNNVDKIAASYGKFFRAEKK